MEEGVDGEVELDVEVEFEILRLVVVEVGVRCGWGRRGRCLQNMHGARGRFCGRSDADRAAVVLACSRVALRIAELRIVAQG